MDTLSHSYQAEHAPRGAEASFSMGLVGAGGGFTLEQGTAGDQDIYLGYAQGHRITVMPYCAAGGNAVDTGMGDFVPTHPGGASKSAFKPVEVRYLAAEAIERDYRMASDTWRADKISFSLITPVDGIPHPDKAPAATVKNAICPAILARLSLDNREGSEPLTGFFAVARLGDFCFVEDETGGELLGLHSINGYGFATRTEQGVRTFSDFSIEECFARPEPLRTRHQGLGGLLFEVPPGECRTYHVALGWFRSGEVTLGRRCSYVYSRYFSDLPEVLAHALDKAEHWGERAKAHDGELMASSLNPHQQWLLAKSIRSYWGSSQLLQEGHRWRWVVNEGSCNMMNTLDLTVDMAFFEAREHPWLLRNVLDTFADEYSYVDTVHLPDAPRTPHAGGVSFTHDQGGRNVFTPRGHSHYELINHPGCFSFMTHEELLNWILCAGIYMTATDDQAWLAQRVGLVQDCLASMLNRDHPQPEHRNGLMGLDSDRCGLESEITTYDSLDPSLGQARNNAYMGLKCWAGYLAIEKMLAGRNDRAAAEAGAGAERAASTLVASFDERLGYIPAILEGGDTSAIIPVVEALVYPTAMGLDEAVAAEGPYTELLATLRRHLEAVLKEGLCLFPDQGWKLSANSSNSWMSKIFICQHVARKVLGMDFGSQGLAHDKAHDHWWRVGCKEHSLIDQVVGGATGGEGSIYPRCVSAVLWLDESCPS